MQTGLYDYQQEMKSRIEQAFESHRSVMVQMPTGTGKTHLLTAVVSDFVKHEDILRDYDSKQRDYGKKQHDHDVKQHCHDDSPQVYDGCLHVHEHNLSDPDESLRECTDDIPHGCGVWIVAHRRELVEQVKTTIRRHADSRVAKCMDRGLIRVMSIQWLSRHHDDMDCTPAMIVIDEAHHALAKSYSDMWSRYSGCRFLGLTATPCRLDGRSFTDLFEVLVQSWSIPAFIEEGRLSVYDYVGLRVDSVTRRLVQSMRKRGADGDFQLKEMDTLFNRRPGIERLLHTKRTFAEGRKGIVYAINIDHAHRISDCYNENGIKACAIDARTPLIERNRLIEAFKAGELEVMVNVDVFSEGFDCPDVEFVQLARPTLSLAKYLQMVGRGLRVAEGKRKCVILDNVGEYLMFGLPSQTWNWQEMFEGRLTCRMLRDTMGLSLCNAFVETMRFDIPDTYGRNGEMTLVVSHESLARTFRMQEDSMRIEERRRQLLDGCLGTVRNCGRMLVELTAKDGVVWWYDLVNMNGIKKRNDGDCASVVRFGNVELIRCGGDYFTRTRRVLRIVEKSQGLRHDMMNYDYYTLINVSGMDGRVWVTDGRVCFEVRTSCICLVENDFIDYYRYSMAMPDGCIVVADMRRNYYLVSPDGTRSLIARDEAVDEAERVTVVLPRLWREICDKMKREQCVRRERVLANVLEPFKMGRKWGLRNADGHIVVAPIYNKVMPPVGRYCAFELFHDHWGVMTVDGRVVVDARYAGVVVDGGYALLTQVNGVVVKHKLPA